jgi:hypothetical protein
MPTPEQHNKYLAISHIAFFLFNLLIMVAWSCVLYFILWDVRSKERGEQVFMVVGLLIVNGLNLLYVATSLVAGWALLKRKPWAKTASLVAAFTAALYIPLGPIVCAYSLWFFFSQPGKLLYGESSAS